MHIDNFGTPTASTGTLSLNSATQNGGGLNNEATVAVTVSNSTLSGNAALAAPSSP